MTADLRSLSPSFGAQAHNEFTQVRLREELRVSAAFESFTTFLEHVLDWSGFVCNTELYGVVQLCSFMVWKSVFNHSL